VQKRWATASKENSLFKLILQRVATPRNRVRRIVAPKVAGPIPVGHPPVSRIGKPKTWKVKDYYSQSLRHIAAATLKGKLVT
jgi:hypothetical protein